MIYNEFSNNQITIQKSPSRDFMEWLEKTDAFLDGPAWGELLGIGFGAERFYLWDQEYKLGHALTIFRKGPFTMGYLGFPICSAPDANNSSPYTLDSMIAAIGRMPNRPHLLRVPISAYGSRQLLSTAGRLNSTVETCIVDLPSWNAEAESDRRRAARRASTRLPDAYISETASGEELEILYRQAIERNAGKRRYKASYFRALASSSLRQINIFPLRIKNQLISAIVSLRHGDTVFYAHGGTLHSFMKPGAADLTMLAAISKAKSDGARRFNFLSSPEDQKGLIRFKEKWGGKSETEHTVTTPLSMIGSLLIRML